ncbi:LysR family transcriptional regulator [Qipengyuania sp. GH25]|uniref:LysR family transcriptional regulator n=1 Tax=Qipengyuania pacifica TaxID=2860199 RepID=A0ABS7JK80_9SPHN|nr:LysR family transcriptional regulator [Qipengyuania aerophila]MBX7489795.1 LysR family transcriptional regulator [Qipengyuania aerophila]
MVREKTQEGLATFVTVVEAGTFSAAASRLELTPSAVSKTISRLEDRLQTRLFRRSTRVLSLTTEGEQFYSQIAPLLRRLDDAQENLGEDTALTGLLRLTMPTVLGEVLINPITAIFMQQHPKLRLEIGLTDQRVDLIRQGYDLALRVGEIPDVDLSQRTLPSLRLCLAASPSYLRRYGRPMSRTDLREHRHIRYVTRGEPFPVRFRDGDVMRPEGTLDLDNGALMVKAAINGAGLVQILEAAILDQLADGVLERILPGDAISEVPVHVLHGFGRHVPRRARTFMDFLSGWIGALAERRASDDGRMN